MTQGYLFLSPEWVHEVTRVVQALRSTDKDFGKLAQGFSLTLVSVVTELPQRLTKLYSSPQLVALVQLDQGTVKRLWLGTEVPSDKSDFTISGRYPVAKGIFLGKTEPATAFIDRQFKVEPLHRVYQRPIFTAQAFVAGSALLKIARRVPTIFPEDD